MKEGWEGESRGQRRGEVHILYMSEGRERERERERETEKGSE